MPQPPILPPTPPQERLQERGFSLCSSPQALHFSFKTHFLAPWQHSKDSSRKVHGGGDAGSHATALSSGSCGTGTEQADSALLLSSNLYCLIFYYWGKSTIWKNELVYGCFCFCTSLPFLLAPNAPRPHPCTAVLPNEKAGQGG